MSTKLRFLVSCLMAGSVGRAGGKGDLSPSLVQVRLSEVMDGDTIRVWLREKQETVRYESVDAPELAEAGGYDSRKAHEALLTKHELWLECEQDTEGKLVRDGRGRLLAYAFLDAGGTQCANTALVRQGAARISIRQVGDATPPEAFPLKHLDELLGAQLEAATNRRGWWGVGDPYAESDFIVCFVRFWGRDEVAWLLNRSKSSVDLAADWKLTDKGRKSPLVLSRCIPVEKCELPPGGICRIHSGPGAERTELKRGSPEIDPVWKRQRVWNNGGDQAMLSNPEGRLVYTYQYSATGN